MIFITGDTHGEFSRFSPAAFPEGSLMTKEDYIGIIAGDFGGNFLGNKWGLKDLDLLGSRPFTTCFIDGNHENFPWINKLPSMKKWGGEVGYIRTSGGYIYHLKRSELYTIQGKTFFTLGGAYSIDKQFRRAGIDWYEDEAITFKDFEKAIKNLEEVDWTVDYVITHAPPVSKVIELGFKRFSLKEDISVYYLQEIYDRMKSFKKWYFGHMHVDKYLSEDFIAIYESIREVK